MAEYNYIYLSPSPPAKLLFGLILIIRYPKVDIEGSLFHLFWVWDMYFEKPPILNLLPSIQLPINSPNLRN